jgi:uncharacterized repeat protein (TIGR01451 family)
MNGNLMDTTCSLVTTTTNLFCLSSNIANLYGVQYFDSLQVLRCNNNNITGLTQLPHSLKELYCDNNLLTSLPSLPSSLLVLSCGGNQLISLPVLPISIQNLFCYNNFITALPFLPNSLTSLGCANNQITVLGALPLNLDTLSCEYNLLSILPSLPSTLTALGCSHNQISNLPTLPTALAGLGCSYNQISALPPLPLALKQIGCDHNLITALPNLPTALEQLYCDHNLITALPNLPAPLIWLYCHHNQLQTLPILPVNLALLSCNNNLLTTIPLLPNTIRRLYCDSNQLSSLPVFPDSLRELSCSYNQLSAIPELPDSLFYLGVQNNPNLTCLPQLKRIVIFNFYNTGIQCIPNYGTVTSGSPSLSSLPLCDIFNTNNCTAYWNISGKIYADANSNCIADTNEIRLGNLKLTLDSAGTLIQQTYTGGEGFYSFDTDTGTYTYTVDTTGLPVLVTCPVSGFQTSVLTAVDSMDYDMDFGMQCKPGFDVGVVSVARDSGIFRPANFAHVKISAGDISNLFGLHCAAGTGGSVQIIFTGAATYIGPVAGALTPAVSGDTLTYTIADFGNVNINSGFRISMQTDSTAPLGSQICFSVKVNPVTGDINSSNNFLQHCFTVTNSYDPNTKEVFPSGAIDTSQQWLTYTINFQNTGSAPAQHIYILDTLDNNIDESSFALLSYSHQPLTQVNGHIVRFNFPNINLPDSTSNEPGSHGYVQYKVKPKAGLPVGTTIKNTANIIFDFNTPVATNTVSNLIQLSTVIHSVANKNSAFTIFPNPAKNEITVCSKQFGENGELIIYDLYGRIIFSQQLNTKHKIQNTKINVSNFSEGVYVIEVSTKTAGALRAKFVKQ